MTRPPDLATEDKGRALHDWRRVSALFALLAVVIWLASEHRFVLIGWTGLCLVSIVLAGFAALLLRLFGRRLRWPRSLWVKSGIAFAHLFITLPAILVWLIALGPRTRGDERAWPGPRIGAEGTWTPWTRKELKKAQERRDLSAEPSPYVIALKAADGTALRGFFVPAPAGQRRGIGVVLTHGFFRSAMELEPVAALLHDLGADVLFVELRNHGGSARARFTAGIDEAQDVAAAIAECRARTGRAPVAMGVSLGGGATIFAVAQGAEVAGLWLDAPLVDAEASGWRQLTGPPRRTLPAPLAKIAFAMARLFAGLDLKSARPIAVADAIDPQIPVMIAAGEDDRLIAKGEIEALFARLKAPPSQKTLWMIPGGGHGDAWITAPAEYRRRWEGFLDQIAPR